MCSDTPADAYLSTGFMWYVMKAVCNRIQVRLSRWKLNWVQKGRSVGNRGVPQEQNLSTGRYGKILEDCEKEKESVFVKCYAYAPNITEVTVWISLQA
jgi:hypothetical protein